DEAAPLYRRLDAADVIIDYELSPGSAFNVPPEQIASTAYQFFRAVDAVEGVPEALKFRALRAIARIENSRNLAVRSSTAHYAQRGLFVSFVNAARQAVLREAGVWETAHGAEWSLRINDDFELVELPTLGESVGSAAATVGIASYFNIVERLPKDV